MQSPIDAHSPGALLPLIVLVGPTAVGKTAVAIELAERLGGEIVSADSRLFYRGMDIGTAKPSLAERRRVPHHLIDVAEPWEVWSLAVFQQQAWQAIADIHRRGRLPLLVGGTGQYIRAVIEGWQAPPVPSQPALRQALERWAAEIGPAALHARLALLDPQAAAKIDYRNLRRTVRALEVIFSTGQRFSQQRQSGQRRYDCRIFGLHLPRPELYARIDARVEAMLAAGLVQEVQRLLKSGCSPELPTLSAIGYREICRHLAGELSLPEAVQQIKRQTRVLVRRQANWFKADDPQIQWVRSDAQAAATIEQEVRRWLEGRGDRSA